MTGLRGMGPRFFAYLRDGRVPRWKKLTGLLAVLYFLSPVDVIPDVLPLLGWLDDLGVLSAAAFYMVRQVRQHRPELDAQRLTGWRGHPRAGAAPPRRPYGC
jgi:uncharacterized membrane protein YkvA (DUF1232 family)